MTDRFGRGLRRGAVIFDCDGTLVDSEPLARHAWERALEPYGYALSDADAEATVGLPFQPAHARLLRRARRAPGRRRDVDRLAPAARCSR